MPLARIRTHRPQDAEPVSEFLIARGYSIELVDPAGVRFASSAATNSAAEDAATPDLDINVEHCSVRDAMERAAALADSAGITAFIAPGVLEPHPAPLPVETLRATFPEPESHAELTEPPPGHPESPEHAGVTDALASVAGSVGDALSQTRSALTESFAELREQITRRKQQAAEVLTAAEHEATERARSGMEAWNRRQAEQRAAREEQERQQVAIERDSQQRRAEERLQAQQREAVAQRQREAVEREQRGAAEAAAQMRREREAAELARQREAAVAAQREVELATARQAERERARQVERAREQRLAEQRALAEAARQRELAAARAPRIPEPRIAPRTAANPHRTPHLPNRTAAHGHWRGAFTGAAALAVLLMIAWAAMSDQRPAATPSDGNTMVQQVPFGPVKLAPTPKPLAPAASHPTAVPVTPRATTQPAPTRTPPARPRHVARGNAEGDVAEDEVIVHHYGPTTPAQRARSPVAQAGPRRISDQ